MLGDVYKDEIEYVIFINNLKMLRRSFCNDK